MERISKLVVIGSAIAAATLHAELVTREWSILPALLAVGVALTIVAARTSTSAVQGGLVAFVYVAAAVSILVLGRFEWHYVVACLAWLLVALLARPSLHWSIPRPWRFIVVAWVLVVAVSWPIVVLRELDFWVARLYDTRWLNPNVGQPPSFIALWIVDVALVQMLGILWFDWLCAAYQGDNLLPRFERQVASWMGGAALLACLVGIYQGLVDISWLSGGPWPRLGRATGTFWDANVFGMVAALWAPLFLVAGLRTAPRLGTPAALAIGLLGALIGAGGVWMSESRTAFLALIVGLIPVATHACGRLVAARGPRLALAAGPLVVIGVFLTLMLMGTTGPVGRIREMMPPPTLENAQRFASALWTRGRYGATAHLMIRDHPFVGVGVGAFHPLVGEFAGMVGWNASFDNAQNWYRHQIAELGLLGSLPWILWVALFSGLLVRSRGEGERRLPAAVLKGVLVGFGIASLFGVPAQSAAVALTFWTFVFWYLALTGAPEPRRADTPWSGRLLGWVAVLALVTVHAAGTLQAARGDLRLPHRAALGEVPFAYGIEDADDVGIQTDRRRTGKVAAFNVPYPRGRRRGALRLKLTAWLEHPDAAERPVQARIWTQGRELVMSARRWDGSRIVRYVDVPDGQVFVVVETWVERTWRPPTPDGTDLEERGMTLAWEWVDSEGNPIPPGPVRLAP